jgi:hypothetical protein
MFTRAHSAAQSGCIANSRQNVAFLHLRHSYRLRWLAELGWASCKIQLDFASGVSFFPWKQAVQGLWPRCSWESSGGWWTKKVWWGKCQGKIYDPERYQWDSEREKSVIFEAASQYNTSAAVSAEMISDFNKVNDWNCVLTRCSTLSVSNRHAEHTVCHICWRHRTPCQRHVPEFLSRNLMKLRWIRL